MLADPSVTTPEPYRPGGTMESGGTDVTFLGESVGDEVERIYPSLGLMKYNEESSTYIPMSFAYLTYFVIYPQLKPVLSIDTCVLPGSCMELPY